VSAYGWLQANSTPETGKAIWLQNSYRHKHTSTLSSHPEGVSEYCWPLIWTLKTTNKVMNRITNKGRVRVVKLVTCQIFYPGENTKPCAYFSDIIQQRTSRFIISHKTQRLPLDLWMHFTAASTLMKIWFTGSPERLKSTAFINTFTKSHKDSLLFGFDDCTHKVGRQISKN